MKHDDLELRAYFALQGASEDWRSDLVAMLRSKSPISDEFREQLARIVEGSHPTGAALDLTNFKPQRDAFVGAQRRRVRYNLGEWIEARIRSGMPRHAAIELAAASYSPAMSVKACDAALDYSRRVNHWINQLEPTHPFRRVLGTKVSELFHAQAARGKPLDKGEQDYHLAEFK